MDSRARASLRRLASIAGATVAAVVLGRLLELGTGTPVGASGWLATTLVAAVVGLIAGFAFEALHGDSATRTFLATFVPLSLALGVVHATALVDYELARVLDEPAAILVRPVITATILATLLAYRRRRGPGPFL